MSKRVGILTGGGDVPGLNTAIKGFVGRMEEAGYEVLGLRRGWAALLKQAKAKKEPATPVRTSQNNASAKPGILSVEAPAGSRVYVDDEPMGQAPIARLTLSVGKHHVEVRNATGQLTDGFHFLGLPQRFFSL